MSDIPITEIIRIDEPKKYKLHAARNSGKTEPLDAYVRSRDEWVKWNRWRSNKDDFSKNIYIFVN